MSAYGSFSLNESAVQALSRMNQQSSHREWYFLWLDSKLGTTFDREELRYWLNT